VHDWPAHRQPDRRTAPTRSPPRASTFTASLSDTDRASFDVRRPNRFAVKHAHSRQNPEKDGAGTPAPVEFAFYVLNEKFGDHTSSGTMRTIHPGRHRDRRQRLERGGAAWRRPSRHQG